MTDPARPPATGPDVAPQQPETPATPVEGAPPSRAELVESAVGPGRPGLVQAAGGSSLAEVDLLGEGPLDLSAAPPPGDGTGTRLNSRH